MAMTLSAALVAVNVAYALRAWLQERGRNSTGG